MKQLLSAKLVKRVITSMGYSGQIPLGRNLRSRCFGAPKYNHAGIVCLEIHTGTRTRLYRLDPLGCPPRHSMAGRRVRIVEGKKLPVYAASVAHYDAFQGWFGI